MIDGEQEDMAEGEAPDGNLTKDDLEKLGAKWLEKIRLSEKREKNWMDNAQAAQKAYLADGSDDSMGETPEFNILHSNVETIVPSIYNSTPAPDIRPRFYSEKPEQPQQPQGGQPGMQQAPALQPLDRYHVDKLVSNLLERAISVQIDDSRLDAEIEKAAQDAFMAGRGVVRLKFDADVTEQPQQDPQTGKIVMAQVVSNERIEFEVVPWCDYRQGPAKRWKDVPWVAYQYCLSHEDIERIEDEAIKAELGAKEPVGEDSEDDTPIWQIWDKTEGRVLHMTDTGKILSIKDDPMGLAGFFPQSEPMQPICATNSLTPVCPYTIYRTLAEELDMTTKRINGITKGLKVRGLLAGNAEAVSLLSGAQDNELIPVPDLESLAATGGLDKAIMWWPIDTAVQVLQQLYVQREQTKQAIYEITGISDIIRGQGAANETATAQQIKTQWGSLRIKKMQRMIERQVRDIFVMCADIISQKFSPQTLQNMTGLQIPPEAMEFFSKPLNHYRINVESDSTVRADLTRGRQEMSEFLQGTAAFFGTMAPIVQQAPQAAGELIDIYSSFARSFSLGKQAEDALERLGEQAKKAATQPQPNPEMEKMKAEMELRNKELDLRGQEIQQKGQLDSQKAQLDVQKAQLDVQLKGADLQLKERELGIASNKQVFDERVAEVDAAARMLEIEMEDDQQRAVKFGED